MARRPLPSLRAELLRLRRARRRSDALTARAEATRAREDTRDWARARRDRTRHLIELGGLVAKAGLVDLTGDDRATLLGAFLDLAVRLRDGGAPEDGMAGGGEGVDSTASPSPAPGVPARDLLARWRRAGLRAFAADREAVAATGATRQEGEETAGRTAA